MILAWFELELYKEKVVNTFGWPKKVVLTRHAESWGNVLPRNDPKSFEIAPHQFTLTDRGRRQAEIAGEYLRNRFGNFDSYFTSYYTRSKETMAIMYPGVKTIEDPRLAEAQWGIWQFMPEAEVAVKHPLEPQIRKRDGIGHYRALGGESWMDIEIRIQSFLTTLRMDHSEERVLIVGHGNWILIFERIMWGLMLEESIKRYEAHEVFKNTQMAVYEPRIIDGKERLVLVEGGIVPAGKV